jgi:hypothetical protein
MPTFFELQERLRRHQETHVRSGADEVLIVDPRAAMRPGDFVDKKLRSAQGNDLPPIAVEPEIASTEPGLRVAKPR